MQIGSDNRLVLSQDQQLGFFMFWHASAELSVTGKCCFVRLFAKNFEAGVIRWRLMRPLHQRPGLSDAG